MAKQWHYNEADSYHEMLRCNHTSAGMNIVLHKLNNNKSQHSSFAIWNWLLFCLAENKMTKIDWGRLLGEGVFDLTITVHIDIIIIRVAEKSLWSWFDI